MQRESLLLDILSQPSAPFREKHVIDAITRAMKAEKVPHFLDPAGNLIVGVASKTEYLRLLKEKSKEPVRIFMAHMDHPGFHGTAWKSEHELEVTWLGGSPTQLLEGANVWLADSQGWWGKGKMTQVQMNERSTAIKSAVVKVLDRVQSGASAPKPESLYGGLSFRAPVWQEGRLLYTKAADDLVGAFAVLSVAIDLFKKKGKKAPFIGLLTRAEEVGFIGAVAHFELGWIQKAARPVLVVSLETSRTLPGADIGKGPVVRLGDRATVFHADSLKVFSDLARVDFADRHQKRIMDGGSCEATAATAYGFPAVGISVPLGNYHNQSFEGGPDSRGDRGPAPEFVHLDDVEGLVDLCHGLMKPKLPWSDPWADRLKGFKKELKGYAKLMKSGP